MKQFLPILVLALTFTGALAGEAGITVLDPAAPNNDSFTPEATNAGYQGTIDTSVPKGYPRYYAWIRDEDLNSGVGWSPGLIDSIATAFQAINLSGTRALTPNGKAVVDALEAASDSLRVLLYVRMMHTPFSPEAAGATPTQSGVGLMEWAEGRALFGRFLFQADADTAVIWRGNPRNYYITDWRAPSGVWWEDINRAQAMAHLDSMATYFHDYGPTRLTGVWWDYVEEDPNIWNGTNYSGGFDLDSDGLESDDYLSYSWGDLTAKDAYRRYMHWELGQARRMHHGLNVVNGHWAINNPELWDDVVDGVNEEFATVTSGSRNPLSQATILMNSPWLDADWLIVEDKLASSSTAVQAGVGLSMVLGGWYGVRLEAGTFSMSDVLLSFTNKLSQVNMPPMGSQVPLGPPVMTQDATFTYITREFTGGTVTVTFFTSANLLLSATWTPNS